MAQVTTGTKYHCQCGEWTGEYCEWTGALDGMVVVEYMPECWRSSHTAAGNSGVYPQNGAIRVAVERSCADLLMENHPGDGDELTWAEITTLDPVDYASFATTYRVKSRSAASPEWFYHPDCTFDERIDAETAIEELQALWPEGADEYEIEERS